MQLMDVERVHALPGVAIGVVVARGCSNPDAAAADALVQRALDTAAAPGYGDAHREALRNMLRHGVYKPTGRGKPASEYLLQAARENRFPRVMPLVDAAHAASVEFALPLSLVDLQRAGSTRFVVRRGRPGERYVFNRAGQEMDLQDLLLLATHPADEPVANPVKDSMQTKLSSESRDVMVVTYAPAALHNAVTGCVQRLAVTLRALVAAPDVAHGVAEPG